jgi:hypothetical protein
MLIIQSNELEHVKTELHTYRSKEHSYDCELCMNFRKVNEKAVKTYKKEIKNLIQLNISNQIIPVDNPVKNVSNKRFECLICRAGEVWKFRDNYNYQKHINSVKHKENVNKEAKSSNTNTNTHTIIVNNVVINNSTIINNNILVNNTTININNTKKKVFECLLCKPGEVWKFRDNYNHQKHINSVKHKENERKQTITSE